MVSNFLGLSYFRPKPGASTKPVPGFVVEILGRDRNPVEVGQEGAVCLQLPLPPGFMTQVWGDEDRLAKTYLNAYPGYYTSGDGGRVDEDGYVYILGRTDDVMNVAGHRMSSGQIEAAIAEHPGVSECAVVGVHDYLKGQRPYAIDRAGTVVAATTDCAAWVMVVDGKQHRGRPPCLTGGTRSHRTRLRSGLWSTCDATP